MKELRDAAAGLKQFPVYDKFLIRLYILYIFVIPSVSIIFYEFLLDEEGSDPTSFFWNFVFFIPLIVHITFVINNLKVPQSSIGLLLMIIRVPFEILVMTLIFEWDLLYALSIVYALELVGFCIGLLLGTVFRKAEITSKHRALSFGLALGIVSIVFVRFRLVFELYMQTEMGSAIQIAAAIICVAVAATPHVRVFIAGKEETEIKMGTSKLSEKLTPIVAVAAIVYAVILPIVLSAIMD